MKYYSWMKKSLVLGTTALLLAGCGKGNTAGASGTGTQPGALGDVAGITQAGVNGGGSSDNGAVNTQQASVSDNVAAILADDTLTDEEKAIRQSEEVLAAMDRESEVDPAKESAADGVVDFTAQKEVDPDIIGWLYVPGTGIDCPVYTTASEDNAYLAEVCSPDMVDFNETIHGKAQKEGDVFADIYDFADPDFFTEYGDIYFHQPFGVMHYAIMMSGELEDKDLNLTLEDSAEDKAAFLEEVKAPAMGRNIRQGYMKYLTDDNFYLTLSAKRDDSSERQFILLGTLIGIE